MRDSQVTDNSVMESESPEIHVFLKNVSQDVSHLFSLSNHIFLFTPGNLLIYSQHGKGFKRFLNIVKSRITCIDYCLYHSFINFWIGHESGELSMIQYDLSTNKTTYLHSSDCHKGVPVKVIRCGFHVSHLFSCDQEGLLMETELHFQTCKYANTFHHLSTNSVTDFFVKDNSLFLLTSGEVLLFKDGIETSFVTSGKWTENLFIDSFVVFTSLYIVNKQSISAFSLENGKEVGLPVEFPSDIFYTCHNANMISIVSNNGIKFLSLPSLSVIRCFELFVSPPMMLDGYNRLFFVRNDEVSYISVNDSYCFEVVDDLTENGSFSIDASSLLNKASMLLHQSDTAMKSAAGRIKQVKELVQDYVDCDDDTLVLNVVEGVPYVDKVLESAIEYAEEEEMPSEVVPIVSTNGYQNGWKESQKEENGESGPSVDIVHQEVLEDLRRQVLGSSLPCSSSSFITLPDTIDKASESSGQEETVNSYSHSPIDVPCCSSTLNHEAEKESDVLISPEQNANEAFDFLMKTSRKLSIEEPSEEELPRQEKLPSPPLPFSYEPQNANVPYSCDVWAQITLPLPTLSDFSVSSGFLIICHQDHVSRLLSLDKLNSPRWTNCAFKADKLSLSDTRSVCFVQQDDCHYGVLSAGDDHWMTVPTVGSDIHEVLLFDGDLWYISGELGVCVLLDYPSRSMFSRLECEWKLESLTVSKYAIWAIRKDHGTLMVRVGLARCRMGSDWAELDTMRNLISVCLDGNNGYALDDKGRLWITHGVDLSHPFGIGSAFFMVPLLGSIRKSLCNNARIKASNGCIFIWNGKKLIFSSGGLSGHRFSSIIPSHISALENFSLLSASSFKYASERRQPNFICLARPNSDLMIFMPDTKRLTSIQLPTSSTIVSIDTCPNGSIAVVDSCGYLWAKGTFENDWLNVVGLGGMVVDCCSSNKATWVVLDDGNIVYKLNETYNWKRCQPPTDKSRITNITSSPNGSYLWVYNQKTAWTRNNSSSSRNGGTTWLKAKTNFDISSIAVGDNIVWALDVHSNLYRLSNLSYSTPSGDGWLYIAGSIRSISVDSKSSLWAINRDNCLVRHETIHF